MKNNFKKSDAQGNKLPEQIGKGLNKEHLKKVLKETSIKNDIISFKIEREIHDKLIRSANKMNVSKSFIIQELIKEFLDL
jgi:hypothetical protein